MGTPFLVDMDHLVLDLKCVESVFLPCVGNCNPLFGPTLFQCNCLDILDTTDVNSYIEVI